MNEITLPTPPVTLLIGHRGTGKSSLLERLAHYHFGRPVLLIDIDQEISRGEQRTISDIFAQAGEDYFRRLEEEYLHRRVREAQSQTWQQVYVALGAGYSGALPSGTECLWVRRPSDHLGRVFLDRPRLSAALEPLEEYEQKHRERSQRFAYWASQEITLLEGFLQPYEGEEEWALDKIAHLGGCLTVAKSVYKSDSLVKSFFERRLRWGVGCFELRDDWLSEQQIQWTLQLLPKSRVRVAARTSPEVFRRLDPGHLHNWDWPSEWGAPPTDRSPSVISRHHRANNESLSAFLHELEKYEASGSLLKAAPPILSFQELSEGHRWALQNAKQRSFLPSSTDGRWRWYRLWTKNRMALHFWREGEGSSPDQPFLLEWLNHDFVTRWFAAILGDPVETSWTPAYHHEFFANRGLPVMRIGVSVDDWQAGALDVLAHLGLRYAAVTSPLKALAYRSCQAVTEGARQFQAANTLLWQPEGWQGTNTDEAGLRELLRDAPAGCAVWGGGGTLGPLHAVIPDGLFFSAKTGSLRTSEIAPSPDWNPMSFNPSVVVWAVGRNHLSSNQSLSWPPEHWRPKLVIDLNYAENSPGKEYAAGLGCEYRSGVAMFLRQAEEQQVFWNRATHVSK